MNNIPVHPVVLISSCDDVINNKYPYQYLIGDIFRN